MALWIGEATITRYFEIEADSEQEAAEELEYRFRVDNCSPDSYTLYDADALAEKT